jgi:hypothetical protein
VRGGSAGVTARSRRSGAADEKCLHGGARATAAACRVFSAAHTPQAHRRPLRAARLPRRRHPSPPSSLSVFLRAPPSSRTRARHPSLGPSGGAAGAAIAPLARAMRKK